jgi:hypothetical protein
MPAYLQPIAQHRLFPTRLLLRGDDGRDYVWLGAAPGAPIEEIAPGTARWLQASRWTEPIPSRVWLHVDDLPIAPHPTPDGVGRR